MQSKSTTPHFVCFKVYLKERQQNTGYLNNIKLKVVIKLCSTNPSNSDYWNIYRKYVRSIIVLDTCLTFVELVL